MFFLITAIIWSAEISLSPYLLKLIIDGANKTENTPALLWATIGIPVVIYASISLIMTIVFRIWSYVVLRLLPALREEIVSSVFYYLSRHSYRYFQEHFSGTLASKLSDLYNGIEQLIQIPNTVFIPRFLAVIFAAGTLTLVQPVFGMILFIWMVVFVIVTIIYAKYAERYRSILQKPLRNFSVRPMMRSQILLPPKFLPMKNTSFHVSKKN